MAARGPDAAAEDLIRHTAFLRRLARGLLVDEHGAEDLVQETFARAIAARDRPRERLRPWLAGVLRNTFRMHVRAAARRRRREAKARPPRGPTPPDEVSMRLEVEARLLQAVRDLPAHERAVLVHRFQDDMKPVAIGRLLGVPASTVRSRLARGLADLRRRLEREEGSRQRARIALLGLAGRVAARGGLVLMKKLILAGAALLIAAVVVHRALEDVPSHPSPQAASGGGEPGLVTTARSEDRQAATSPPAAPDALRADLPAAIDLAAADRRRDLFGRVLDVGGRPVAGADVTTHRRPWERSAYLTSRSEDIQGPATRSAADGSFLLRLGAGRLVDLHVRAAGFAETTLARRQAGERVDVVLYRGASLRVAVVGPDGGPVAGADVRVWRPADTPGSIVRRHATTDAAGHVHLDGLTPGEVRIDVRHPRLVYAERRRAVVPASGEATVTVALAAGRTVHGRVVEAGSGRGITGARVGVGWSLRHEVRSGEAGRFSLQAPPDASLLEAVADGFGRGDAPMPAGEEPAVIRLARGDRVAGRVVAPDGSPLSGAIVVAMASLQAEAGQQIDCRSGTTGPDGRFLLTDLRRDLPHTLLVEAAGHAKERVDFRPHEGSAGLVDLGRIVVSAPRTIRGRVLAADGTPVPGVPVVLRCTDAHHLTGFYGSETRMTDDLGRFTFPDQGEGTYTLRAKVEGAPWLETQVDLTGRHDDVRVELRASRGGTLVVRAVDAAQRPLAHVMVVPEIEGRRPTPSPTGADGRVRLTGLPDGAFTIRLHPQPPTGGAGRTFRAAVREGVVADGGELEVVLEETLPVRGVVHGPGEVPLACVFVQARARGTLYDQAVTDDQGRFSLRLPRGGPYRLVVDGRSRPGGWSAPVVLQPYAGEVTGVVAPSEGVTVRAERLAADRSLTVRVLRPDGSPVSGAPVTLAAAASRPGPGTAIRRGTTDAGGRMRFEGLTPQPLRVEVGRTTGPLAVPEPARVVPDGGEIVLRMRPGAAFRGVVQDADGRPVEGADVRLFLLSGMPLDHARSDANGRFTLFGVPGGHHQLYAGYEDLNGVARSVYRYDLRRGGEDLVLVPE